jgi:radical SAM superfamily enzyme YgiQ (UPF0313 family)
MGNMSNVSQIPGLFAREIPLPSGSRIIGEELSIDVPVELDYEPFMSRLQEYFGNDKPTLTLETSRGCWWGERAHCTFCGLTKTRKMQQQNIFSGWWNGLTSFGQRSRSDADYGKDSFTATRKTDAFH